MSPSSSPRWPHWLSCGRWEKQADNTWRQVDGCANAPNCCITCGDPGIWRDCVVDELCMCTDCWAASEVASAIRRQGARPGQSRERKQRLRQGLRSDRQRQLKRTRRYWRGVCELEDDGEHGRTRRQP
jgi:hypothetical protein